MVSPSFPLTPRIHLSAKGMVSPSFPLTPRIHLGQLCRLKTLISKVPYPTEKQPGLQKAGKPNSQLVQVADVVGHKKSPFLGFPEAVRWSGLQGWPKQAKGERAKERKEKTSSVLRPGLRLQRALSRCLLSLRFTAAPKEFAIDIPREPPKARAPRSPIRQTPGQRPTGDRARRRGSPRWHAPLQSVVREKSSNGRRPNFPIFFRKRTRLKNDQSLFRATVLRF